MILAPIGSRASAQWWLSSLMNPMSRDPISIVSISSDGKNTTPIVAILIPIPFRYKDQVTSGPVRWRPIIADEFRITFSGASFGKTVRRYLPNTL